MRIIILLQKEHLTSIIQSQSLSRDMFYRYKLQTIVTNELHVVYLMILNVTSICLSQIQCNTFSLNIFKTS